jgi:hypothetical protein
MTYMIGQVARHCRDAGVTTVYTDPHCAQMVIENMTSEHRLRVKEIPETDTNKPMAIHRLQSMMREGNIILPRDDKLREELLGFAEIATLSGRFRTLPPSPGPGSTNRPPGC